MNARRFRRLRLLGLLAGLLSAQLPAAAAEPVRRIGIYVQPYYEAAPAPDAAPRVAVGKSFDGLLASLRREDILAARDKLMAQPTRVTPMTMMVLAIRLYEVGLRDEAVFWFYAAKDRAVIFADVIDTRGPALAGAMQAVASFATLAGPAINGYAFCDLGRQRRLRAEALAWVEANPYAPVFMPQLPARAADRKAALARAVADARTNAEKERAFFEDAKNVESFRAARRKNEMDEKYCWK
jgi:hypothetical protein